jgi:ubiquinol-cytochrome c reductase cytochrome b subunit
MMTNKNKIYNIFNNVQANFVSILPLNLVRLNKNYLVGFIDSHVIHYPSPITLTYAWSFGSLSGICLVIQMISGIFLAMHYTPHIDLAFSSIEYIMRDVHNGWLIRYIHANGASMFFILVYSHICRGLYYGSYMKPREHLWFSGIVIFLLIMVTAISIAGQSIVQLLWGGYTVGNPTLNRFFSIHFVLPFLIAGTSIIHLSLFHKLGSNSPIGSDTGIDDLPFYPYFAVKDAFAFFCFMLFFITFVFYFPNVLNHPDNYIPAADSLNIPAHVVLEWYFLPHYAILVRSIPHKVSQIKENINIKDLLIGLFVLIMIGEHFYLLSQIEGLLSQVEELKQEVILLKSNQSEIEEVIPPKNISKIVVISGVCVLVVAVLFTYFGGGGIDPGSVVGKGFNFLGDFMAFLTENGFKNMSEKLTEIDSSNTEFMNLLSGKFSEIDDEMSRFFIQISNQNQINSSRFPINPREAR